MKNKSSHHQTENTFKFQTFHERLAKINIDVVRKLGKHSLTPEDSDTFFAEALDKWSELNCTRFFVDFRKAIVGNIQSLPQLIHHQDAVVDALEKHLCVPDSMALQPLLDLVVQLARDLQADFYPYFERFFHVIVSLLATYHHQVELLEQAFTCLAYLFKFLWRCMLKDLNNVYRLFCPLLSNQYKDYLKTFAAESFAFLMRKTKTPLKLFQLMFKRLEDAEDQVDGVGCLLFEMIKGVQHQFHSSTEKMLSLLLSCLADATLHPSLVLEALSNTWRLIAQHTTADRCAPLWRTLLESIDQAYMELQSTTDVDRCQTLEQHVTALLKLLLIWVQHKDGVMLAEVGQLVQLLLKLMRGCPLHEVIALDVTSSLLLTTKCTLVAQYRPSLISAVFKSKYNAKLILSFTRGLFKLALFEKDLLPALLMFCQTYCAGSDVSDDSKLHIVSVLSGLLQYKATCDDDDRKDGHNVFTYPLDFSTNHVGTRHSQSNSLVVWMMMTLKEICAKVHAVTLDDLSALDDLCLLWALMHILPHIRPQANMDVCIGLEKLPAKLFSLLTDIDDSRLQEKILCVLYEALQFLLHTRSAADFYRLISLQFVTTLLSRFPENVLCLRVADLYFSHTTGSQVDNNALGIATFKQVFGCLQNNLSSPYSRVRVLTLHILCQFELPLPVLADNLDVPQPGVFRICLDAELVAPSVHKFRDKLLHLRKLEVHLVHNQMPLGGDCNQVPLRYLIGMLHVNFTMLWKPSIALIKSHAESLGVVEFWNVFSPHVHHAAQLAEKELLSKSSSHSHASQAQSQLGVTTFDSIDDLSKLFDDHCLRTIDCSERPDPVNFRRLIWTAMLEIPASCEARSRILSPLLFRFIRNEHQPADVNAAQLQDISRHSHDANEESMETSTDEQSEDVKDAESDDEEEEDSVNPAAQSSNDVPAQRGRASNKTLVTHMAVFAKFKNPRSTYLEPELRELYLELLMHPDPQVQRVAFDCIMSYNYPYLTAYKENFERLLDDKSFKNEIVLFSIAEECTVILEQHRDGLLPILMRLLYGKMQTKTGKDTAGRSHSQLRKNIILRFLAGSRPNELQVFLDLIFAPFKDFYTDDVSCKVTGLMNNLDLQQVIPLRKQQGILSTVELLMKKLGSLLDSYLPNILRVLVCLAGMCSRALHQRHLVAQHAINPLKALRISLQTKINQFFATFDKYPYCESEVDAIFAAVVWPQLDRLHFEGIYSPTPLLKLFTIWSSQPRYIPLLVKCQQEDKGISPLVFVFRLLGAKLTHTSVSTTIVQLVENLLAAEPFQPTGDLPAICCGASVDLPETNSGISYGTCLLLPHVSSLLGHLSGVVKTMTSETGKKSSLPERELNILARLSEFVLDRDQSSVILRLLLPFLGRRLNRSARAEVDIVTSVQNLILRVENCTDFLPCIAKLFSSLSVRTTRTALCGVLQAIASREPSVQTVANIVTNLNAWDARRVDEPDYMKRLDAFKQAQAMLKAPSSESDTSDPTTDVTPTVMMMLLHNCVFFLATTDDMSLRDSSTLCLQEILNHIAATNDRAIFQEVVMQHLLPELKVNLKLKSEVARHEFISLLAHLVKLFPDYPSFSEMVCLTDYVDVEVDFFRNITHIQLHRRTRALHRLCNRLRSAPMRVHTLVPYLLPICTSLLSTEQVLPSALVDASILTIGLLASRVPWPRYLLLLRRYLALLPKSLTSQKLIVRVLVSILDGFHFDLLQSQGHTGSARPGTFEHVPTEGDKEDDKTLETKAEESLTADSEPKEKDETGPDEDEAMDVAEEEEEEDEKAGTVSSSLSTSEGIVMTMCDVGLATRIHRVLVRNILPQLHNCLTHKAKSDDEHKMANVRQYAEDSEILRVPLAIAMVKLLQVLPHGTLQRNLPGVLLKVCHFLRSRAQDIRQTARSTLIKVVQSLGPSFFPYILREMRSSLQKGYQLHVLSYSVWAILNSLDGQLKNGQLDSSMESLVQVLNEELFGQVSEEKEVQGIVGKLLEARSSKSFDSYYLLAKHVSKASLAKIIMPLKAILDGTHSQKKAQKAADVLKRIGQGLVENEGIALADLLTFVFALTTEALPGMQPTHKSKSVETGHDPRLKPTDTFIVAPEPARGGKIPKAHGKTNMYIIVEFGMQLLYLLLKKARIGKEKAEHLKLLNPFISTLTASLESKHVKVATATLRCLGWLIKFPLPALKKHISAITNHLFVLLSNYATAGAAKGDNFQLVVMCFKTMTILVRDINYLRMRDDQLRVLLGYIEQDIHDYTRQATAFSLLRAILSRKQVMAEIPEVMQRVEHLSVTADSASVRLQCRQVVLQFLLDYPLGKKLNQHLEFYVTQLEFEHESGRESTLEMLASIFAAFPRKLLMNFSGFFFIPMAGCLVNDESLNCRKLAALAIKSLLTKLDNAERDKLFNMCIQWLQGSKVLLRKLAALAAGLFVEVEATGFERHLSVILPIIEQQVSPPQYQQQDTSVSEDRDLDMLLFSLLTLLTKICQQCVILRQAKWTTLVTSIWEHLESHLLHPHTWVRLVSSQLFGLLFGAWQPVELVSPPTSSEQTLTDDVGYFGHLEAKLHDLCGVFCKQLGTPELDAELAQQIIKNMVFIAKVLKRMPCDEDKDAETDEKQKKASLYWLVKRMCKEAKLEASLNPKLSVKRSSVFKWLAAIALDLEPDGVVPLLPLMLVPLVREINDSSPSSNAELKQLSQEVVNLLKKQVGVETFSVTFAACQKALLEKRDVRKRERTIAAVADPELNARKKIKKNLAKKESQKRKLEELRPTKRKRKK